MLETVTYSAGSAGLVAGREGAGRVSGTAVLWDVPSLDRGGFHDRFARGSLRIGPDVPALLSHDSSIVLGRTSAGTLALEEREHGIAFSLALPDTQAGRDLLTSLKRGDVSQCSFSALILEEDWDYSQVLRAPVRTVLAAELLEISIVPLPAFPGTSARAEP